MMKYNYKPDSFALCSVMSVSVIVTSWLVLSSMSFAQDGIAAWEAGVPKPDSPHVIAGKEQGHYVPEPGWRFVSDAPDDFTVEPLPAKKALVSSISIPAPKGFWSVEGDHPVAKLLNAQAEADKGNITLGQWVRTENGEWDDIQNAFVKVAENFNGRCMSLSLFATCCESMKNEFSEWTKKAHKDIGKVAEAASGELTKIAETDVKVAVGDIRFLPPYLEERDRICFTIIRKDKTSVGEETYESFAVVSSAMMWIRGTTFTLSIGYAVVSSESDLDGAITSTRDKLRQWMVNIDDANNRMTLDVEDAIARTKPNCMNVNKVQKNKSESSSIWTRVIVWTIIGGAWGLISTLFKKKRSGS